MNLPSWTLLLVAALGFCLALQWSSANSGRWSRRHAGIAMLLALSALDCFLLSSQLAARMPVITLLGGVFPLLLGPLWWRAQATTPAWSLREWRRALTPAALVGGVLLGAIAATESAWLEGSGVHAAQWLLLGSCLSALGSRPRAARTPVAPRIHLAAR